MYENFQKMALLGPLYLISQMKITVPKVKNLDYSEQSDREHILTEFQLGAHRHMCLTLTEKV